MWAKILYPLQHVKLLHQSQQKRLSIGKSQVTGFCYLIIGVIYPQCCRILWVRSKLVKGKRLFERYQEARIYPWGRLRDHFPQCSPSKRQHIFKDIYEENKIFHLIAQLLWNCNCTGMFKGEVSSKSNQTFLINALLYSSNILKTS